MKLTEKQRSATAEAICRRWIRRRGIRLAAPKVYVIRSASHPGQYWGWCYGGRRIISLHFGKGANIRREQYILLAHEFAHYLDYWTSTPKWRRANMPHGEQFQRLLWNTLPRSLWKRAASGNWVRGSSAHRPEFQPRDIIVEVAAA